MPGTSTRRSTPPSRTRRSARSTAGWAVARRQLITAVDGLGRCTRARRRPLGSAGGPTVRPSPKGSKTAYISALSESSKPCPTYMARSANRLSLDSRLAVGMSRATCQFSSATVTLQTVWQGPHSFGVGLSLRHFHPRAFLLVLECFSCVRYHTLRLRCVAWIFGRSARFHPSMGGRGGRLSTAAMSNTRASRSICVLAQCRAVGGAQSPGTRFGCVCSLGVSLFRTHRLPLTTHTSAKVVPWLPSSRHPALRVVLCWFRPTAPSCREVAVGS
jgi:hypothetical protein